MTITLPPALDVLVVKKMATGGFEELDRGDYVELDREGFMEHFRARRQVT